ncbi:MAG: riboflavin transporter [Thermosediminibacterales bacterium]|nr:riboflavin transporter [Thermosediminibacterales bacterium]MDK2835739.1 riboflavin transporter [Thermosediminibacterales bacterium]
MPNETLTAQSSAKTRTMVKLAVLSVVAFLLQYVDFPLPFLFPAFLKIDFSDVPALIGAFSLGPFMGVVIELLKNILHFIFKNETAGVGEFANFITGASLVYVAGLYYFRKKSRTNALIGMILGTIFMAILMSVANYYVFLPLYEKFLGFPMSAIIQMGTAANPAITDLKTLVVIGILPFNIIKGAMICIITFLLYKKLSPILHE